MSDDSEYVVVTKSWLKFNNDHHFDAKHKSTQLEQENEELKKIIKTFMVKSNALSMYVRSDLFGKSGNEHLNDKLWDLYHFQCDLELSNTNNEE